MAKNALAELGMNPEAVPVTIHHDTTHELRQAYPVVQNDTDYFVEKDGLKFAGTHLILEFWGASRLDDPRWIERKLRDAALAADATILHSHMHHFSPNGGVSGVVVLAESHISIHTWPERDFAALDIFMCGKCDPYKSIPVLRKAFGPDSIQVTEHRRGLLP